MSRRLRKACSDKSNALIAEKSQKLLLDVDFLLYPNTMLIEFKITNFRSIREEQTFSLVANNADKDLAACITASSKNSWQRSMEEEKKDC